GVKAREELFKIAAEKLGVKSEELELANRSVMHRKSKRRMSFAEIVKARGEPSGVKGYYKSSEKAHDASVSAQIAEVHIDPETGQITLRQMTSAHTTGKVINPLMHQGQIDGGVVFGLGYALTEEVLFDGGKVTTTNFGEFKIPNITDIPPLKTAVIENVPHGPGPYNSLAIGEVANVPVAAAVAQGGVQFTEITVSVTNALDVIEILVAEGRLHVAAGTVLSNEEAEEAIGTGAQFIVSPSLELNLIPICHDANVPCIPGAATPTEILAAARAKADLVKIFPADTIGGPDFVRQMSGPFPD